MLYLDLETRSDVDLIFHGLRRYAEDPSTEVICMAYAFDEKPTQFWWSHEPFPRQVSDYFNTGVKVVTAHNAEFERHLFEYVICNDYDITPPKTEQWECSMTRAIASGYPAGLGDLAVAIGLPQQKHAQGARLIKMYCGPGHAKTFAPGDAELMREYCIGDVDVMRTAAAYLTPEHDMGGEYALNCKINDAGLPIDVELCEKALQYTDVMREAASVELQDITKDMPTPMTKHTQRKTRDAFLKERLTEAQSDTLKVVNKKGKETQSLDQDHRALLLEFEDLDPEVARMMHAINDGGSSALKKYAVAAHQHVDGRVHNTFQFYGAQTGRFSGRGLQPHNMRRDAYPAEEAEAHIRDILAGARPTAEVLARLLRSMITSVEGIYYVDWSAIEGRVGPWLTADAAGEAKLELYRSGRDVYSVTAALMFLKDGNRWKEVDADNRQTGKIAELSLQFGGSKGALQSMAKNYGKTISDNEATTYVDKWRENNTWAGNRYGHGGIWESFGMGVKSAFRNPGEEVRVGRCTLALEGSSLVTKLPSGRYIIYPQVKRDEEYTTPWGEVTNGPTFQTHFRPAAGAGPLRQSLRGALLFQNATQGAAADVLRCALLKADAAGLKIIGSVHDEIIGEGPKEDGERLDEIMLTNPDWATGLPLATGGVSWGKRYGK